MVRLLVLLLVFLALPVGLARATTVTDGDHHFVYELPRGWTPFTDEEIADLSKGTGLTYLHGARQPGVEYLLVGVIPRPPGPLGPAQVPEFRTELESGGPKVVTISFDSRRNAVVAHLDLSQSGTRQHAMSYYFVGKDEIVNLLCFAPEEDIMGATPTFERIADSFHFDSAATGQPRALSQAKTWMVVLGVVGGLVCAGVALLIGVGILFVVLKKRKAAV